LVIRSGDVVVRAPLNQTQAAHDLMNRLPLSVSGHDSGVDYCCGLKEGTFDEAEKQQGWTNGDVSVADGWFAILHGGQGDSARYGDQVVMGRIEGEDLRRVQSLSGAYDLLVELAE
jgi:hypothetical protein